MEIAGTSSVDLREALTRRAIVLRQVLDSLDYRDGEAS
jgi:hypothetical protein